MTRLKTYWRDSGHGSFYPAAAAANVSKGNHKMAGVLKSFSMTVSPLIARGHVWQ